MSFFLGRGWSFPPRFDVRTCAAVMTTDVEDIQESLHILFSTQPRERVMLPAYGCDLHRFVFAQLSEQLLTQLSELVRKAVLFYEPRIILHRVDAQLVDPMQGEVRLRLDYSVRTTNSRHNLVYPLYLHQATQPVKAA
jgi:phage baseplate assembly protein W